MRIIKHLRYLYLSLFVGFITVSGLVTGCIVKIPAKTPTAIIERRIPYYVVLIIPENIKHIKCSHPEMLNFEKFNCGAVFYDVYLKTMGRTFIYTYQVTDIKYATKHWERALYLEIDKFEIVRPFFDKMSASISLSYKITDQKGKELLSSTISVRVTEAEVSHDTRMLSELIYKATHKMADEIVEAHKNKLL